jgi:hypothetical protein
VLPTATLRLAAVVALAVTLLSLAGMALQYRLVEGRLMVQAQGLLAADLDGFAALYEQRRIIALRQAIEYRAAAANPGEMLMLLARDGAVLAGTHADWPATVVARGDGRLAHARHRTYEVVEFIGRWSMIDVFVVAILSSLIQLGSAASVKPGIAALSFALSVAFTMLSAMSFDSRLIWDADKDAVA